MSTLPAAGWDSTSHVLADTVRLVVAPRADDLFGLAARLELGVAGLKGDLDELYGLLAAQEE